MKKSNWLAVAAAAFLAGAPIIEAEAKRLGSGSNMGRVAPGSGANQAVPAARPAIGPIQLLRVAACAAAGFAVAGFAA